MGKAQLAFFSYINYCWQWSLLQTTSPEGWQSLDTETLGQEVMWRLIILFSVCKQKENNVFLISTLTVLSQVSLSNLYTRFHLHKYIAYQPARNTATHKQLKNYVFDLVIQILNKIFKNYTHRPLEVSLLWIYQRFIFLSRTSRLNSAISSLPSILNQKKNQHQP